MNRQQYYGGSLFYIKFENATIVIPFKPSTVLKNELHNEIVNVDNTIVCSVCNEMVSIKDYYRNDLSCCKQYCTFNLTVEKVKQILKKDNNRCAIGMIEFMPLFFCCFDLSWNHKNPEINYVCTPIHINNQMKILLLFNIYANNQISKKFIILSPTSKIIIEPRTTLNIIENILNNLIGLNPFLFINFILLIVMKI